MVCVHMNFAITFYLSSLDLFFRIVPDGRNLNSQEPSPAAG